MIEWSWCRGNTRILTGRHRKVVSTLLHNGKYTHFYLCYEVCGLGKYVSVVMASLSVDDEGGSRGRQKGLWTPTPWGTFHSGLGEDVLSSFPWWLWKLFPRQGFAKGRWGQKWPSWVPGTQNHWKEGTKVSLKQSRYLVYCCMAWKLGDLALHCIILVIIP